MLYVLDFGRSALVLPRLQPLYGMDVQPYDNLLVQVDFPHMGACTVVPFSLAPSILWEYSKIRLESHHAVHISSVSGIEALKTHIDQAISLLLPDSESFASMDISHDMTRKTRAIEGESKK